MTRDPRVPVAYGQGYTKLCRLGCGARIWLVPKADGSGWMALNLEPPKPPAPAGNIAITNRGLAVYIRPDDDVDTALFIAHQATCPRYLKERAEERQTRLDIDG